MGYTSSAVKNKYNKKAYKSFTMRLKPELYDRVDKYCQENGLSRPQFMEKAIALLESNRECVKKSL